MNLRTGMDLVSIEFPASRVPLALSAQPAKLFDVALRLIGVGKLLEVFSDELVYALTHGARSLTRALEYLFVNG